MEEKKEQAVQTPSPAPSQPESSTKKLPPFIALLREAWMLLKQSFVSIIKLLFVMICAFLAVAIVIGAFVFFGMMFAPALGDFAGLLILGGLGMIIFYVVSLVVLTTVFQITMIRIFTSPTRLPIIKTLKESLPLVTPFFFTLLLAQFLMFGGFWLLIFPGIVIAFLFSFVNFVVVTENLKGRAALMRSYQLVRPYIWKIVLVSMAVQIPVNILTQIFAWFVEDYPVIYILYFPFVLITGYYIQALSIVLYKNAKAITPVDIPVRMKWILVVASIGWVVFLGLIFTVGVAAVADPSILDMLIPPEKEAL